MPFTSGQIDGFRRKLRTVETRLSHVREDINDDPGSAKLHLDIVIRELSEVRDTLQHAG